VTRQNDDLRVDDLAKREKEKLSVRDFAENYACRCMNTGIRQPGSPLQSKTRFHVPKRRARKAAFSLGKSRSEGAPLGTAILVLLQSLAGQILNSRL
jgi:hypothetical protein